MSKRKIGGWILLIVAVVFLTFAILEDHHVNMGPFTELYHMIDWISIRHFFSMIWESFGLVFDFIGDYFWYLIVIILALSLIAGGTRQKQNYDDYDYRKVEKENGDFVPNHETRRLVRNADNKMISGVCSGIAAYFRIDPTLVRIIAVFLLFTSGFTLCLVYLFLAILLPERHQGY